jgi:hypothetical protein
MVHPRRSRRQCGEFNVVTAILLLVTVAVGYAAYVYLPPWMRNRRVYQAMKEASYQAWRQEDDALRKIVLQRTGRYWPEAATSGGKLPDLGPSTIAIRRDPQTRTATIEISYDVVVDLPFLNRQRTLRFDNRVEASTLPPSAEKPSEFLQWLTQ